MNEWYRIVQDGVNFTGIAEERDANGILTGEVVYIDGIEQMWRSEYNDSQQLVSLMQIQGGARHGIRYVRNEILGFTVELWEFDVLTRFTKYDVKGRIVESFHIDVESEFYETVCACRSNYFVPGFGLG